MVLLQLRIQEFPDEGREAIICELSPKTVVDLRGPQGTRAPHWEANYV